MRLSNNSPTKAGTRASKFLLATVFLTAGVMTDVNAVTDSDPNQLREISTASLGANKTPNNPNLIKQKERKLDEVTAGTIMRSGVVYPKHKPLPELDRIREFLRQNRPATSAAEVAELIKGLQSGDPDALANFEKYMATYLAKSHGTRSAQIIDALNAIIDTPNMYKTDPHHAQRLLDKAFDKFITMDYNMKNDLDFSRTNLDGKFIAGLDLRKTGLGTEQLYTFSDWASTNVSGLDLSGVDFKEKNTTGTIFKHANLSNTDWSGKNMQNNNLTRANLSGANLSNTNLSGNSTARRANFNGSNLSGANGAGGNFELANFREANMQNSDFSNSNLRGANLSGANVEGANFEGAQRGGVIGCVPIKKGTEA